MKAAKKPVKWVLLVAILLLPATLLLIMNMGEHSFITLPHYGQKIPAPKMVDGKEVADTIYHQVPTWTFTNQDNIEVSQSAYDGEIYVVDYIFTSCPGICPRMTTHMSLLQFKLDKPGLNEIPFISYTVDPERDSPEVLKQYGIDHDANFDRWTFLTGRKKELYELGVYGYMVSTQEDALAEGGFLHSEKFILMDWNHTIRGYYNGTDINEVNEMVDDIKILIKEQERLKK